MKRNMRTAYNRLKKMGAPVFVNSDCMGNFKLSAEQNDEEMWADYYYGRSGFPWVNPEVEAVMEDNGLFLEWENAGCLSAYEL